MVQGTPALVRLAESAAGGEVRRIQVLETARPAVIAALHEMTGKVFLVVCSSASSAKELYQQLSNWLPAPDAIHLFPELNVLPYERLDPEAATVAERLRALAALIAVATSRGEGDGGHAGRGGPDVNKRPLIITSVAALLPRTIGANTFATLTHELYRGMKVDPDSLLARWEAMGYNLDYSVEAPGTMSRRGGIVDIFPPSSLSPVRIEFEGDRIESMRPFDSASQRSKDTVLRLRVVPAQEYPLPLSCGAGREKFPGFHSIGADSETPENAGRGAMAGFGRLVLDCSNCRSEVRERIEEDLARIREGQRIDGVGFYLAGLNDGTILDFLPQGSLLVLDETAQLTATAEELEGEASQLMAQKVAAGDLPADCLPPNFSWEELEKRMQRVPFRLHLARWSSGEAEDSLPFLPSPTFGGRLPVFLNEVQDRDKEKQTLVVVSQQASRLAELLGDETPVRHGLHEPPVPGSVSLVQGSVNGGWTLEGMTLLTDAELFGYVKKVAQPKKRAASHRLFLREMTPGQYVVHVDHGIARFSGVLKRRFGDGEREYLVLEYAAGDRLYVPSEQIDRVSPYIGPGERLPSLTRLGTQQWARTKERIKARVEKMAQELLGLYASRKVSPGFAFPPDSIWQQELEASFPHSETPDQIQAVAEVKADMEEPHPMDRLVCGDVGYGKTEVALRAAFKAVMAGKQVAILVPTTILAQQHYNTFKERLSPFPTRVAVLSRFVPDKERETVLGGLTSGSVDICIGTHRLLQRDVVFKDLGLVIIDEEQRFGVRHKEWFKQLRQNVDVLSLSATPIPRTLHMSLVGIRDMSAIDTPPEERLPIKTYVSVYQDEVVRAAILRELERNGQVFVVHNRVETIGSFAREIEALVPEARVAIAHGQIPEEQLEQVMLDFVEGKSDVLVCTTIIESGLDMPRVNTLIVNAADKFGLAQLYQLRGRVGRSANRAYAYFLHGKGKRMTPQAQQRLQAIFDIQELGGGFRIAMKDLEIRGAGNLLGVEQSGYISAVGFDLYCQLLAKAVEELEGGKPKESSMALPSVDLPLTAFIPEDYVSHLPARLSIYQRLASMIAPEDIEELSRELKDRFGPLPEEVERLLFAAEVRVLAGLAGIESVYMRKGEIVLKSGNQRSAAAFSTSSEYGALLRSGPNMVRLGLENLDGRWTEILQDILRGTRPKPAHH